MKTSTKLGVFNTAQSAANASLRARARVADLTRQLHAALSEERTCYETHLELYEDARVLLQTPPAPLAPPPAPGLSAATSAEAPSKTWEYPLTPPLEPTLAKSPYLSPGVPMKRSTPNDAV